MSDGNGFTNKEILIRLEQKVDEGFKDLKQTFTDGHGDHEKRIRFLERIAWGLPASIVIAVLGFIR